MPEARRHFDIPIGLFGDFIRVAFVRDGKQITFFVVQYFARIGGNEHQVLRFDTAHDFAHCDILDWEGATIRKVPVREGIDYATAMNEVIADLKANWERYRADFLRRRP